jgi:8-oxo-dGTP diphosphatase
VLPVGRRILVKDGKLLLGRRSAHKKSYPCVWDIIGGHVEPGEQNHEALVRELEEEIGVTPVRMWPLADAEIGETHTLSVYLVDAWSGEPAIMNDEHPELGWFTPGEASALTDLASPHIGTSSQRFGSRGSE